jgi:hypothetical protein
MMRNFNVTLTTNKELFLLDYYLSFYILSLLMYARTHWRISEFTINWIKMYLGLERFFEKMVNRIVICVSRSKNASYPSEFGFSSRGGADLKRGEDKRHFLAEVHKLPLIRNL